MYLFIGIALVLLGIILLIFPHIVYRTGTPNNKPPIVFSVIIRIIGAVFVIIGLLGIYVLMSGQITLPLNK